MKTRAPVYCKDQQILAAVAEARALNSMQGNERAINLLSIYRTQYGVGKEGAGPTGYKLKPARKLARALAEAASHYRTKRK